MAPVKRNILYSIVLSCSQYIVPLIVFPYISRVLGPEKLGLVNFIDGTIDYYIILSMLGMGTLGIRETARYKHNPASLNITFSSLITLNFISTVIACSILLISFFTVDAFHAHPRLILTGGLKLIFNFLLIEWFYKGLEEFKFITIRTIIVRLIYIIAIFLFVRNSSDYLEYYYIFVGAIIINATINILYSRHFVHFSIHNLKISSITKPFIILGFYTILTAMYTTFNIMYLGIVGTDVEVAYYTTSTKIYGIIIAMFTAFTGVMMPRLSALLANGQNDEFKRYINKSLEFLIAFSIPVITFGVVMTPEIINLISGPEYSGAIIPMRIVMPLVFIIGIEQILVYQILIPNRQDRTVFINSIIGGILGVAMNLLIVSSLGAIGSSIVWVSCECTILILSKKAVNSTMNIKIPFISLLKNILVYIPLAGLLFGIKHLIENSYIALFSGMALLGIYIVAAQTLVLHNAEFMAFTNKIKINRSSSKDS